MSASYHDELKRIFAAACACEDPADRARLLDELCGDDADVRRDVESLLAHDAAPVIGLDGGPGEIRAALGVSSAERPERIGDYRILDLLGEGGMGVVYLAEQESPQRVVALKVLRRAIATPALRARFRREAAALARLQHPAIAPIYAAGADEDGQPYIAMEHVRGLSLLAWARDAETGLRARVAMLVRIAEGVQHAHDRGVLHRDLKPTNILVDDEGRPKILDFGVARIMSDGPGATLATVTGQIVGTVPYMSPEQIDGRQSRIDARTDVYALGVLGFELLAGRLPYDVAGASIAEAARIIRDRTPDTLSTVTRDARGDLETIVGKALEKAPDRRYQTVGALADDLQRFLDGRAVLARPPSVTYQLRKLASRHRALFAAAIITVTALVAATVVSTVFAVREARARAAETLRAEEAQWQAYVANIAAVEAALQVPDVAAARRRLEAVPRKERDRFEARAYAGELDGAILALDVAPRDETEALPMGQPGAHVTYGVAWSPDETRLAAGTADGTVLVWSIAPGRDRLIAPPPDPRRLAVEKGTVLAIAFAPAGNHLAAVTDQGTIDVWNVRTWERAWSGDAERWSAEVDVDAPNDESGFGSVAYSADGAMIAIGTGDGLVHVRDASDGTRIGELAIGATIVWDVVIADDNDTVIAAGSRGEVAIGSIAGGSVERTIAAHVAGTTSVALAPDGRRLVTGGADGLVRVWHFDDGSIEQVLSGHTDRSASVAFLPDGRHVLSTSSDGTARLWDLERGAAAALLLGHASPVDCGAVAPSGAFVATGANDGTVRVWHVASLLERRTLASFDGPGLASAASSCGLVAVSAGSDPVRLLDASSGAEVAAIPAAAGTRALAFSADGGLLAVGEGDGTIRLHDLRRGEEVAVFVGHAGAVAAIMLPDDDTCLSVGFDGTLRRWSRRNGPVWSVEAPKGRAVVLDVSGDGKTIVTGGFDGKARLWSALDGAAVGTIDGHEWVVSGVGFLPGGGLMTASFDGTVRFWSDDLRPDGVIEHDRPVLCLAHDAARRRVALSFNIPRITIYDTLHRTAVATLRDLPTIASRITWTPDGSRILAVHPFILGDWSGDSVADRAHAQCAYEAARDAVGPIVVRTLAAASGDVAAARAAIDRLDDLSPLERRVAGHLLLAEALRR